MPKYEVSKAAQNDLNAIARYTARKWGREQAIRYLAGLRDRFQMLAENPGMGRSCDSVSIGLHRHESGSHVIFYRIHSSGIFVSRVLHENMPPLGPRLK